MGSVRQTTSTQPFCVFLAEELIFLSSCGFPLSTQSISRSRWASFHVAAVWYRKLCIGEFHLQLEIWSGIKLKERKQKKKKKKKKESMKETNKHNKTNKEGYMASTIYFILARICLVLSKSPLGAMLILAKKLLKEPHILWLYLFLDNGDPTFLFNLSNLHTITVTKIISEISHLFWKAHPTSLCVHPNA